MTTTRAAIYTRLSDDRHGTGLAVQRQEEDCRKLADLRGWRVVDVFSDNDLSGHKRVRRPGYTALMRAVRDGRVDAVIVYSVDRLTRRVVDLAGFLDTVHEHDVAVATVSGDLDTSTAAGRMVANILGSVAQAESERISERVMRKQDELAERGLPSNGGALRPYGYERDRVTVVESERVIVREIAERLLAGESVGGIVRDLNERGVPTSTGKPWTRTTVKTLVTSSRAVGMRVHRGKVVGKAAWEPLLDEATWERVRVVMAGRGAHIRRPSNARKYLLSGDLSVCAVCGQALSVAHHGAMADGTPLLRYACRKRHAGRRVEHLDEFVVGATLERLADPRLAEALAARRRDPEGGRRLAALKERRAAVVGLLADPEFDPTEIRTQVTELNRAIAQAEQAVAESGGGGVLDAVVGLTREAWDALPLDRRRAIVAALFDPVEVGPAPRRGSQGFQVEGVVLRPRDAR